MSKTLEQIEVGDRVWMSGYKRPRFALRTVAKLTPKQIVLDGRGERCHRSNGVGIGHGHGSISGIATPEECAEWDAAQKVKADEAAAWRRKVDEREAKRRGLNALFDSERVYIQDTERNLAGEWQVCVYASEDEVRRIAEVLRGILG